MLTPQQQQLLTRTILQTQDVLKRCVAIMKLETKVFTSSLQLEFIRTTSYSTVMSLMDMLNMYAIAQQQFLPVVVQALEVIWIFAESSQDAVNHLHEWISKELLKTLPALLAVQKQSKHAIYSIKVVKLFTDRFLKVIRSHPSSIFQEQLLSMVAKLFYHQLDELLGQDMRRLLTLLHRPQSQDQWFHWRNNLHHMKEQVVSISICLAEVASRSAFVSMSVLDGWIKSSTDLIVRSVIYFFHNEYEHVKHELCDVAMEIIKALLQNMMLLKKWKMSKSSTNSSSNSHDYILNENLLTMRLWLALFLWKSKMRLAVDAEVEADLHESLQELAKHTAPMSFSRILCNASTSKKKQSDIVDELFENDNDLVSSMSSILIILSKCNSST